MFGEIALITFLRWCW